MSDASLAEAQRLARIGSWQWMPDANRWIWSDELYRIAGLEPRSLFPTQHDLLAMVDPTDRERVHTTLQRARETPEPFALVHNILLPDGEMRSVQLLGEPRASDPTGIAFIGTMQDITEQVRAETAMHEATVAAQEASRVKTQLLSMASHDLRTPLTAIQGYIEIVLAGAAGELSDERRNLLTVAHRNTLRLSALVNDLLDLARIGAGRLPLHLQPTSLDAAITHVLDTVAPLAAEKGIELMRDTPATLPPISADPDRLNQILLNLIGNAVKFTERGVVTVSARGSILDRRRDRRHRRWHRRGCSAACLRRVQPGWRRGTA